MSDSLKKIENIVVEVLNDQVTSRELSLGWLVKLGSGIGYADYVTFGSFNIYA